MKRVIILTEKEYENAMRNVRHDEDMKSAEWLAGHDKQVREEVLDELFNTEVRSGRALKEVYEEAPINDFDEGWNKCYEDFAEVAEQLKGEE